MAIRTAGKRNKVSRWLIGLLVMLIVLGGAGAAAYFLGILPNGSAQAASVQTTQARRGTLRKTITGSGTYAAGQSADLSFRTTGILAELNTALGESVTEGQVLARIGDTQALEAAVSAANVELLQAQADLQTLQEGAHVSLAQAYVDWVSAKSAYDSAQTASQRIAYARCGEEVNLRYAAALKQAQERLTQQAKGTEAYTNAQYDVDTATANYNYCIGYTESEVVTASAELDLAKQKLDKTSRQYEVLKTTSGIDPDQLTLLEAKVDETQKLLEQAELDLAGASLVAPISGTVTYLAVEPGVRMESDQTFITISDLTQPVMDVSVDEADLSQFVVGSRVSVVFDALPDDIFTGTLVEVLPQLQNSFNTSVLTGTIELDENDTLKSLPLGLNATVEIISEEIQGAVLIPLESLHALPDGNYSVTVLNSSGVQEQRTVELGLQDNTSAQIISGLAEGEQVVITIDMNSVTAQNEDQQENGVMLPGVLPGGGGGAMPPGGMP